MLKEIMPKIFKSVRESVEHLWNADIPTRCVTIKEPIWVRPADYPKLRCRKTDCQFNTQGPEGETLTYYRATTVLYGAGAYCQAAETINPSKEKIALF